MSPPSPPAAASAPSAAPLGHFLELAIPTRDIAASVQFYERLGFTQRLTGDAWPHAYGVLGDARIHLGLHELHALYERAHEPMAAGPALCARPMLDSPTPCFVHPDIAHQVERLRRTGLPPERLQIGEELLHHLWLRDPGGHTALMQEARTFSPAATRGGAQSGEQSLCGYFLQLSLPEPDFEAALGFWERAGFVGLPQEELPYAHRPLTSDALDLAFHTLRTCDAAVLVFECPDTAAALERLHRLQINPLSRPPRGLSQPGNLVLESPEGTLLLLAPPSGY